MTGSPRLLHIAGPSKFGGDSVLILELALAAVAHGYQVDVLAADPLFQDKIREAGLGLVDSDVIRREIRPLADLRAVRDLTAFLSRNRYDIVHTHTSKPGVVGRLAARRAGVPSIVHTVHGFGFHEESGRLETQAYVAIERMAARWCDRIITVSEHHRERALSLGIGRPDRVLAIPNGVPDHRAQSAKAPEEVRAELGVGESLLFLSTGRLAEQKGLAYLIRAVARLDAAPPFHVVLAGDGPLRGELQALADGLGISDRLSFLGYRDDVGDLLRACDVFVMPSLWEGLSISLLEAMAAGKPVITTSIASNREVTDNGRFATLVAPKDVDGLARAMVEMAGDEARRAALGQRGRQRQQERYSMTQMLVAHEELYRDLRARFEPTTSDSVR